jgi:hypothetical protein
MREISDAVDCTIHVDADLEGDDLGPLLTERLGGTFAPLTHRRTSQEGIIEHGFAQIEIEFNSHDADPVRAMACPSRAVWRAARFPGLVGRANCGW